MDTSVSHFDSLAKYAAASFKKSRSCSTLASLRLSNIISLSCALPWPGNALSPWFFASSRQRRSCRVLKPSSSATSVSVTPSSFARRRASQALSVYGSKKINEDVTVPRAVLPQLLKEFDKIAEKYNINIPCFGNILLQNIILPVNNRILLNGLTCGYEYLDCMPFFVFF